MNEIQASLIWKKIVDDKWRMQDKRNRIIVLLVSAEQSRYLH